MDFLKHVGILLPIHFSYFDPSKDWFDLGIVFLLLGFAISYVQFKYATWMWRHTKRKMKEDYYDEIRWWVVVLRGLGHSIIFSIIIKFVLLGFGVYHH